MNHNPTLGDPAEQAALHAAGALTDAERTTFEARLTGGCETARAELAAYGPVIAALAAAVPPVDPGPGPRAALLQRVADATEDAALASPLRRFVQTHARESAGRAEPLIQRAAEGTWEDTAVPGVRLRVLAVDQERDQFTALVRMAPGTSYPRHVHQGPEECLVLEGDLHVGGDVMRAGDYQRAEAGSAHGVQSTEHGCLLFITSSLSDEFA